MKHIKRILSITICLLIMLTSAFYSYTRIDGRCLVYADSTTDNWNPVTTNQQLVEAFKYYCKSRDLTIEGSIADGVTSFTTKTFNGICNTLGIDVTALQAHLKYETDGNNGLKFLFDSTGISAYNRIFAQFLQDYELSVGDSANETDNTIYNGITFKDYYGNTLLCVVTNSYNTSTSGASGAYSIDNSIVNGSAIEGMSQSDFERIALDSNISNGNYYFPSYIVYTNSNNSSTYTANIQYDKWNNGSGIGLNMYVNYPTNNYRGYIGILYRPSNSQFYLTGFSHNMVTNKWGTKNLYTNPIYPKDGQSSNCIIFLNTNNTVINNNNYEGDTIINNNGTPSDPNAPDPDDPTYNPPDYPSEPTDDPSNWGVELPDLDIPWFLRGKEDKFPWDIPYSMILLLSVLNAEPEAPHIEGTLDLGVYEWNYELDLSEFDDVATICRNMMFVAFLFGLMLLTKRLIWG